VLNSASQPDSQAAANTARPYDTVGVSRDMPVKIKQSSYVSFANYYGISQFKNLIEGCTLLEDEDQ